MLVKERRASDGLCFNERLSTAMISRVQELDDGDLCPWERHVLFFQDTKWNTSIKSNIFRLDFPEDLPLHHFRDESINFEYVPSNFTNTNRMNKKKKGEKQRDTIEMQFKAKSSIHMI